MTTIEDPGSTVLADYTSSSGEHSPDREILMANVNGSQNNGRQIDPNEMLQQISGDELSVNVPPDEDDITRGERRKRNQRWEARRQATMVHT